MAKSTCDPNAEVPKGMKRFKVIRSTIKDSLGQYCVPGDYAVLKKEIAKGYLDKNFIQVELPDFDESDEGDENEGDTTDSAPADTAERTEAPSTTRGRNRKNRAGASS